MEITMRWLSVSMKAANCSGVEGIASHVERC